MNGIIPTVAVDEVDTMVEEAGITTVEEEEVEDVADIVMVEVEAEAEVEDAITIAITATIDTTMATTITKIPMHA